MSPNRPRQVFNLSTGADTGGAAIREVQAFASLEANPRPREWEVRAMVAATNYIDYPRDLPYSVPNLRERYDAADLVHLNHTMHGHTWYDDGQGKPTVLEHHGLHKGSFDIDFEGSIRKASEVGARQIGSTVNLELFAEPGVIEWAPIPYNLDYLTRLRAALYRPSGDRPVLIAHAPTVRAVKSTEVFLEAIRTLQGRGRNVTSVLIEGRRHEECLQMKAICDILFDQLTLGYGCNAIEAMGMGIPVVAGIENPVWQDHAVSRYDLRASPTGLPFISANPADLADILEKLVISSELRQFWAEIGLKHANKWHSEQFSVQQMSEIYRNTPPSQPSMSPSRRLSHQTRKEILQSIRRARAATLEREAEIGRPSLDGLPLP